MGKLIRAPQNPIILPSQNVWEQTATFNGCVVTHDSLYHMVYRALSAKVEHRGQNMQISTIGHAQSSDGITFVDHQQFIVPEYEWEAYGCEDPRITKLGNKYYIFYTALSTFPFSAAGIRVGLAITRDFKNIDEKHLITPFNAKAMCLFPDKVNDKYVAILTANTDLPPSKIALAFFDHEDELWDEEYWYRWYSYLDDHVLELQRESNDQVEVGAPPLLTDKGWLFIYSHIKNYYSSEKVFGIEAVLLDKNDPFKILARTEEPLLIPEEYYEKYGEVPNIVFPSGAIIKNDTLMVYYGAADTTCCVASISLSELFSSLKPISLIKTEKHQDLFNRFTENPIIMPNPNHDWEAKATFNPAAFYENDTFHIVYRALSKNNISTLGYAKSQDGFHIFERLADPIYTPREEFEKNPEMQNAGCEDPRIVKLNDRYYMCYTAFNNKQPPRVALTSIAVNDFLNQRWEWEKPKLISPPNVDDKDASFFPRQINGKYYIFHRLDISIWLDSVSSIDELGENRYLQGKPIMQPRNDRWDKEKIGIAGPPIETDKGWLLFYHGIDQGNIYKIGAVLLDLDNPEKILARSNNPVFKPETHYEQEGQVPNVVFPCSTILRDGTIFLYYGGADSVIGVATASLSSILTSLDNDKI